MQSQNTLTSPFHLFIITMIMMLTVSCSKQTNKRLSFDENQSKQFPKALFITSGIDGNKSVLPKGIVVAIQALNKKGVIVRLETRDILFNPQKLAEYNLLILSTSRGYHDADRQYSLSFMSDGELKNIASFVENGGVLIVGDNVGRNTYDGSDRITIQNKLDMAVYPLANCLGVTLKEENMGGYSIKGSITGTENKLIREKTGDYFYTLVPEAITSDSVKTLANWVNKYDTVPAIIKNRYGNGTSYLFASSDFLHPANDAGLSSVADISDFYHMVVDDFCKENNINIQLNPWPDGHKQAFCMTLNAEGNQESYNRIFKLCKKKNIPVDIFVSSRVETDIKQFLEKSRATLQSNGYSFANFRSLDYSQAVTDVLSNEQLWNNEFSGFRFPYTMPSFWGFQTIDVNHYNFESSIGANNLEFIHGSVVPHNLAFSGNGFYTASDMLEIAPTYHDDYFFLKNFKKEINNPFQQQKMVDLYTAYLKNYWEKAVKPYKGVMVYQGHPAYVASNDTTMVALEKLIDMVKSDDTWIASIDEIAKYRGNLSKLRFYIDESRRKTTIKIKEPEGVMVSNVSLKLNKKAESAESRSGKVILNKENSAVTFDAFDGQIITIFR